jgi:hypothetical protein
MLTFHYASLVLPPAFAAYWFCRLARRSGRGLGWSAAACILIASLALVCISELRLPYESHQGRLLFGLALPIPQSWAPFSALGWREVLQPASQLWKASVPLAVLAYMGWQACGGQRAGELVEQPPLA